MKRGPKSRNVVNVKDLDQLCWTCAKACGGCVWSASLLPVEGWDAEQTQPEPGSQMPQTYVVKSCPEYEEVTKKRQGSIGLLDPDFKYTQGILGDPVRMVYISMIRQAVRDYAHNLWKLENEDFKNEDERTHSIYYVRADDLERFFLSDYFALVLDGLKITGFDGEDFIQAVKADPETMRHLKRENVNVIAKPKEVVDYDDFED